MNKQAKLFQDQDVANDDLSLTPVIKKKGRTKLTAAQSEFNRLNRKINELKAEITFIPEKERKIRTFYQEHAKSLFEKETAMKYDYLIYLDGIYEEGKLSKTDRKTLIDLIAAESEGVTDYMNEEQRSVIVPLVHKYEELLSGMTHEELEMEAVQDTLFAIQMMGFKLNKKMKNAKTEEELLNAFNDLMKNEMEKMEAAEEKEQQRRAAREEQKSSQSRERKMTKAELNQKLQEEQTLKSMREIYLELVKELHPDRETDETLRAQKEERMKQLTEAYKQKDLASLLMMQINWLQEESAKTPQSQTDEVSKRYNKILRAQLNRLEEEFYLICQAPLSGVENAYTQLRTVPLKEIDIHLDILLSQQKNLLKTVEEYMQSVSTLTGMRAFLKKYRKKQREEELYDDFYWEED